ncbi:DUF11 domain-containing protein [Amycolatopsis sacchari]|uniref:DUF11 domain-containing protein n=1 Tax=Amycolatopsis sacchari TaxID=115433 RepID=UPI003EB98763
MRRPLLGLLGAGMVTGAVAAGALSAGAAQVTADVPLQTIGQGPASATLANGVTASVDQGRWGGSGLYLTYPADGPQTWSFSEPVSVRFGITNLNGSPPESPGYECVQFPDGGVAVESLAPAHTWDPATSTLCHTGPDGSGTDDETVLVTTAPTTSLTWAALNNPDQARGISFMQVSVGEPAGPQADLSVVKSGPDSANAGDRIEYTLLVMNNGPADSTGFVLTDRLPRELTQAVPPPGCTIATDTITCTGGPLAVGAGHAYTFTAVVDQNSPKIFTNSASVAGNEDDPNPGNNSSSVSTMVTRVPMVSAGVAAGALGLAGGGWLLRRRTRPVRN